MGKRGQILADEQLVACKRYIRFRETGSPDPVEVSVERTWRFVEAKDVDDFKMGTKLGGALYDETGAKMSVIGTRDAERIAALLSAPPAGRAGERGEALEQKYRVLLEGERDRVYRQSETIVRFQRELAEARAAIRMAAMHTTWPAINKRNVWLALPAVQAARNPST